MKNLVIALCVALCGGVMCLTSCTDAKKVSNVYSLHLEYEQKIKDYERLDTMTTDEVREELLHDAEEARKDYLRAFSHLSDSEKKEYKKLEAECKSADEDYLGSEYIEETNSDSNYTRLDYSYQSIH